MISSEKIIFQCNDNINDSLELRNDELEAALSIGERLPKKIIDAHAHYADQKHVTDIDENSKNHIISTFPYFTIQNSIDFSKLFYPNCLVNFLRFGMVFRGIDYVSMNRDIGNNNPDGDKIALFGPQDNIQYILNELKTGRYSALKMYYSYARPISSTIKQVFPESVLDLTEKLSIPIILHLPRPINFVIDELLHIKQAFPNLKITICHLGSSEIFSKDIQKSFAQIEDETDFVFDTSMNHNEASIKSILNEVNPRRIMFGSDAPFNLIRSVPYIHPQKGSRVITERVYHWTDQTEYDQYSHIAKNAVHAHWRVVSNLLDSIESAYANDKNVKNMIFFENAKAFYKF